MYYDTHVHFDGLGDEAAALAAIDNAKAVGVGRMVAVGGAAAGNDVAVKIAKQLPETVCAAVGFDRDEAGAGNAALVSSLTDTVAAAGRDGVRIAAIGEIGLDFHYHPETAEAQIDLFRRQLALAAECELPAIVHSREANTEILAALKEYSSDVTVVLHCYTGNSDFATTLLDLGLYISFSGIVTFRNADMLRESAKIVPDDRLLIETDTPYLAPIPHRGKENQPAYVLHVAEMLAQVRGTTPENIGEITTANAEQLFDESR